MKPHLIKLLSLTGLAAALFTVSNAASADAAKAPNFSAEPCCNLCPEAHDAKNYTTRYQQNFTTLVQAQGDWLFRTQEDLRTEFTTTPAGFRRLKQLREAFKSKGIELVVVYQPTRGLVNRNKLNPQQKAAFDYDKALKNYQGMLARFAEMGYVVPDLSPLTNEALPETLPAHDFYFRGDQHWTPYGAQRTAKIVAEKVKHLPEFAAIPKREFETKVWAHGQDRHPAQHGRATVRHQLRHPVHGPVHHRAQGRGGGRRPVQRCRQPADHPGRHQPQRQELQLRRLPARGHRC